jgi:hypothetical protein
MASAMWTIAHLGVIAPTNLTPTDNLRRLICGVGRHPKSSTSHRPT